MTDRPTTPTTVKDVLAKLGLVPRRDFTVGTYSAANLKDVRSLWDSYADRAAELEISVVMAVGYASVLADILRCQQDASPQHA